LGREPTCVWNILAVSGKFKCGVRISTNGISVVLGMEAKILLVRASHHRLAVYRKLEYEFGTEPCKCGGVDIRVVVRRDSGDNGRLNNKCRQCRSTLAQLTVKSRGNTIQGTGIGTKEMGLYTVIKTARMERGIEERQENFSLLMYCAAKGRPISA
jgi:hypothetical protein